MNVQNTLLAVQGIFNGAAPIFHSKFTPINSIINTVYAVKYTSVLRTVISAINPFTSINNWVFLMENVFKII